MPGSNPMEPAFIGQLEKIVESIFRQDTAPEIVYARLKTHLERAEKLGLPVYEGEVHNAIALAHAVLERNDEAALQCFLKAHDCAINADDFYLQLKASNNIGSFFAAQLLFDRAYEYYQQVIELGLQRKPLSLGIGFSLYGCTVYHIVHGRWQQATESLNQIDALVDSFEIKTQERNDYARLIHLLRSAQFYVALSMRDCESARSSLGIVQSLAEQLGLPHSDQHCQLQRLYESLCHSQDAAYIAQLEDDIQAMGTFDALGQISLLYHLGKDQPAGLLLGHLLRSTSEPTHRARIETIFNPDRD